MDSNHYFLLIVNWTAIQTRSSLSGGVRFEQLSIYPISSSSHSIAVEYFVLNHHKKTVERKPELTLVNVIQFNQLDFRGNYRIRTYDLFLVREALLNQLS